MDKIRQKKSNKYFHVKQIILLKPVLPADVHRQKKLNKTLILTEYSHIIDSKWFIVQLHHQIKK